MLNYSKMQWIETHAHLYLPEFDADRALVIEKAQQAGVQHILLPAIDSSTHEVMLQTEALYPVCHSMIGLHPCSVNDSFNKEISQIKGYLQQRSFIAIGEIGLDFYWDKTYTAQQYEAFHQQIQLALSYGLPIVIHSRNATNECIEVVQQYTGIKGVFHCFSGTVEQAQTLIELGFYLGIGGVVTFKNAGLDKVIEQIGLSNVVLETDAPYLAPVPYRGKRNESSYLRLVADKLSALLALPINEVAKITTQNAQKLFSLP